MTHTHAHAQSHMHTHAHWPGTDLPKLGLHVHMSGEMVRTSGNVLTVPASVRTISIRYRNERSEKQASREELNTKAC